VVNPYPMRMCRALVTAGSLGAVGIAAHTAINLRFLRTPPARPAQLNESVDVLIPARNEETHIERSVRSVLSQEGVPLLRVLVLDDGSTDNTAAIVRSLAEVDPRVLLLSGADVAPPIGWLGKPWACARLAEQSDAAVVTFVDADVELLPHAIAATVHTLRAGDFALVAPYPFQLSESWLERLIQPLVTWSWTATMPLRWAENSTRPSLSAANGQLLVLDAAAYRRVGGHGAVRADVLEDIGLMRALKSASRRTATVDGSKVARCRMYAGMTEVVDGYAKSLWSAFNGPVGSAAVCSALGVTFVVPAVAAVASRDPRTRAIGLAGYVAGVVSRGLVARHTGERVLPDVLAQPVAIAAFIALNVESWHRHVRGTNTWKGRAVTVGPAT
jgi:hypothetical protein